MKIDGPGVYVSARVCRYLAPALAKHLQDRRDRGMYIDLDAELTSTLRAVIEVGQAAATSASTSGALPPADVALRSSSSGGFGSAIGPTLKTTAVAARLGCTTRNVRDLAERGRLRGHRTSRGWTFDPAEVEQYAAEHKEAAGAA